MVTQTQEMMLYILCHGQGASAYLTCMLLGYGSPCAVPAVINCLSYEVAGHVSSNGDTGGKAACLPDQACALGLFLTVGAGSASEDPIGTPCITNDPCLVGSIRPFQAGSAGALCAEPCTS